MKQTYGPKNKGPQLEKVFQSASFAMAPVRQRQSISKEKFSAYCSSLKTVSYHDPSSRGVGSHGYAIVSFQHLQTFPRNTFSLHYSPETRLTSNERMFSHVPANLMQRDDIHIYLAGDLSTFQTGATFFARRPNNLHFSFTCFRVITGFVDVC